MREISFCSFNSTWEKSFVFDSLCGLTVGNLKELLVSANSDFKSSKQLLVYSGRVLELDNILIDELVSESGDGSTKIEFRVFSVQVDPKLSLSETVSMDPLSIAAAKEYLEAVPSNPCGCFSGACLDNTVCMEVSRGTDAALVGWKALLDGLTCATQAAPAPTDTASSTETTVTVAPVAAAQTAAAAVPVAPAGPVLPVVDWLQWGVMAKLIVVAFLFTYNRNLSTERLVHMAAMTVFSYFFQIGALSYWAAWICHKLGFDFTPPPRPLPNNNNNNNNNNNGNAENNNDDANADNNVAVEGANGGANNAVVDNNLVGAGAGGAAGAGAAAGVQNNVRANNAPNNAPAVAAAPFNLVHWLNEVYHSGFTIPTAPGILMDIVALFMGLFFSIVPSWAPYRL